MKETVSLGMMMRFRPERVGEVIAAENVRCFVIVDTSFRICYYGYGGMFPCSTPSTPHLSSVFYVYIEIKFIVGKIGKMFV